VKGCVRFGEGRVLHVEVSLRGRRPSCFLKAV